MTVEVASEIWHELKRYINVVDRGEAAENLISMLVDHDFDIQDLRDAFKGDSDIKKALAEFVDDDKEYNNDDEEDYYDVDEDDDYNKGDNY